jgi:hypothetical protein
VILELGSGQSHASLHLLSQLTRSFDEADVGRLGTPMEEKPRKGRNGRGGGRVVLSDLGNVVPLVRGNVERWLRNTVHLQTIDDIEDGTKTDGRKRLPDVKVVALSWGDIPAVDSLLNTTQSPITHILMIDLVRPFSTSPVCASNDGSDNADILPASLWTTYTYFDPPHELTPRSERRDTIRDRKGGDGIRDGRERWWTRGDSMLYVPTLYSHNRRLILLDEYADKARSLEFEETFFSAFERWFRMAPLLSQSSSTSTEGTQSQASSHESTSSPSAPTSSSPAPSSANIREPPTTDVSPPTTAQWSIHGQDQGVYTYICHRRADTLPLPQEAGSKGWWTPQTDEEAMRGPRHGSSPESEAAPAPTSMNDGAEALSGCGMQERLVDRSWGWAEAQLGAIEWD